MFRRFDRFALPAMLLWACGGTSMYPSCATGQETSNKPAAANAGNMDTVAAQEMLIQHEASFNGMVVAAGKSEIAVSPKTTQSFKVITALPYGAVVKSGDLLVEFDTKAYNDQVMDQEATVKSQRIALDEMKRDLMLLEKQTPMDSEQAEIAWTQAKEDFEHFKAFEFPFAAKANEQGLKNAKDFLDYTEEELKQLEKMYKADDLTEESEEIVLRRAKDDFERQSFNFERTKMDNEREKKIGLARQQRQRAMAMRLAEIAHERAKLTLPMALEKKKQEVAKAERELQKAERTLAELKEDGKWFQIKAPMDGVVYYGRSNLGKWEGISDFKNRLRPYGAITVNEIFMTILDPRKLEFVGNIPEAEAMQASVGNEGRLQVNAFPQDRIPCKLQSKSMVPNTDGSCECTLALGDHKLKLSAGLSGSLKLVTYRNPKAIVVPSKSVFAEEGDEGSRFVYLMKNGKPVKEKVSVGYTSGEMLEIRSGLKVGDAILIEKPKPAAE